jgi:hypothetical protein
MLWSMYVVEVLFFTGLIGCTAVVVISWISIFKSGFSNDHLTETERNVSVRTHES